MTHSTHCELLFEYHDVSAFTPHFAKVSGFPSPYPAHPPPHNFQFLARVYFSFHAHHVLSFTRPPFIGDLRAYFKRHFLLSFSIQRGCPGVSLFWCATIFFCKTIPLLVLRVGVHAKTFVLHPPLTGRSVFMLGLEDPSPTLCLRKSPSFCSFLLHF